MGVFSFLAGNTKSIDKVVDAGMKGLDALVFTAEEKAEYQKKIQETYLEFVKISATESTAQSISRRLICLPVVYSWLFFIFLSVGTQIAGYDFPSILTAIDAMGAPALAAIGFYVGRHLVRDFKK